MSYLTGLQVKVNRSEGFPHTWYFIPGCVGTGAQPPKWGCLRGVAAFLSFSSWAHPFSSWGRQDMRFGVARTSYSRTSYKPGIGRVCSDYKTLLRLQDFSQTTRLCSDYKTFLRLQDFAQTTRRCSDYKTLLRLQGSAQTTRLCSDYKTLLRLQDIAQITGHCSDYKTLLRLQTGHCSDHKMLLRPQDFAQITRHCPDYMTLLRLQDIAQTLCSVCIYTFIYYNIIPHYIILYWPMQLEFLFLFPCNELNQARAAQIYLFVSMWRVEPFIINHQ